MIYQYRPEIWIIERASVKNNVRELLSNILYVYFILAKLALNASVLNHYQSGK